MSLEQKTDNETLVKALRVLANDIVSDDGVANACIADAADRIEELQKEVKRAFWWSAEFTATCHDNNILSAWTDYQVIMKNRNH